VADTVTIDTSEFDRAIAQLGMLPKATLPFVRKALQFNVNLIKSDWRGKLQGNPYAPRVPYSITYETRELPEAIEAEIGAEKGTGNQGGVALLLEYGAPARGLGARGYGLAALQENLDDLKSGVGQAIDDGLRAVGL
jgi:hypothetical protein